MQSTDIYSQYNKTRVTVIPHMGKENGVSNIKAYRCVYGGNYVYDHVIQRREKLTIQTMKE